MGFPLRKTIQVMKPGEPTYDRFGNLVPGTPTLTDVKVFGWGTAAVVETTGDGTSIMRTMDDLVLYCPPGTVKPDEQVQLPGQGTFTVEGNEINDNNNPWWKPGLVQVKLRKVEG